MLRKSLIALAAALVFPAAALACQDHATQADAANQNSDSVVAKAKKAKAKKPNAPKASPQKG